MADPKQMSFNPAVRRRIALGIIIEVGALLAIVALVNYLAARHFRRFDMGASAQYPLSPLTLETLRSLTNEVKVTILLDRHDPASLYAPVSALLREYAFKSPKVIVQHVDYLRDPAQAQLLKVKHRLPDSGDKDLILFESLGQTCLVSEKELSEYDISGLLTGKSKEIKRTHFKGELFFTSAIIKVLDRRSHKVCFLQGHREHKPFEEVHEEGYAKFVSILKMKGIAAEPLVLQGPSEIPSDCEALIIAGPRDALSDLELEKIEKFLREGGRLFLLFGHFSRNTGLENLAARWGIEVGNNMVRDPEHTAGGLDVYTDHFSDHPIVKPLFDTQIHLNLPRSIEKKMASRVESAKIQELAFTGQKGQVVTDIREGIPNPNPRDRRGTISLGAALEKGGVEGVSAERGLTRMVVMGDSIFLGNQGIESLGNRDFASLAVNWLLDRPWLLAISPRPIDEYRLYLSGSQMTALRWVFIGAIPAGTLILGGIVWARRRF